jgi:hypothetical protein
LLCVFTASSLAPCRMRPEGLFRRRPKLELAVDEAQIKWRRRPGMRAIEQLPVRPVR